MKETRLPCPVEGCRGRRASVFMVMCASCWRLVPRELQDKVYAAWKARRTAPDAVYAERARAHEDVKAQAIGHAEKARRPRPGAAT